MLWERASVLGGSSGAAADRDLDSVLALFAAAARFTDRLPQASAAQFLEHLAAQQIPGDALFARDADSDAVQVLTAHASKGLEWDLVCVANVQEGSWPDLRQRGSLLGSEILVDVVAGRHVPNAASFAPQLAEERRLFYVAVTRARRRLVVTAVSGQDEQPSRFLDELDPIDGERDVTIPPRGVHLPGLIAELRAAVCDPSVTRRERSAAASELARLAVESVPGADPDDWWGLAGPSIEGPMADPDRPVRISPSRIDSFLVCELRDVLRAVGASDGDQISASLGTLIHDVAAKASPDADLDEFERLLDDGWGQLDFGARWLAVNERARAREILDRLVGWLRRTRDELTLVAVEESFDVTTGDVELVGRVDRIEKDHDGRLVVIDLKTGKSKPRTDDLPHHPQLGAYQMAVALGGFAEGDVPGGARLVQLAASGMSSSGGEQAQGPLADADDPQWVADALEHDGSAPARARVHGDRREPVQDLRCRVVLPVGSGWSAGDRVTALERLPAQFSAARLADLLGLPAPTDEQAAVIESPLQPGVVIAGAGSGKTETMASRVVWLVANRYVAPGSVLGLTFTRKAASELGSRIRRRLAQWQRVVRQVSPDDAGRIAELLAGEPTVSTYAAYAGRLVGEHAIRVGAEPNPRLLSEAVRWQLADAVVRRFPGTVAAQHRSAILHRPLRAASVRPTGRPSSHGRAGRGVLRSAARRVGGAARRAAGAIPHARRHQAVRTCHRAST